MTTKATHKENRTNNKLRFGRVRSKTDFIVHFSKALSLLAQYSVFENKR